VTSINLTQVYYPDQVKEAVDDTQKAGNDRDRFIEEARAYANDIIPKARGERERRLQDAEAYRDRVIADSEGEASRFEALLGEYQKAPRVTRDRLYLEAVEEVYRNSNKVLLDTEGSGNLLYLPLDKLIERSESSRGSGSSRSSDNQAPQPLSDTGRDTSRDRRTRQ